MLRTPADCQSAIQQVANLRYEKTLRRNKFAQANKFFMDRRTDGHR
jgi:hypothetical protein